MPHSFRGQPRGLMHLSGGDIRDGRVFVGGEPVDPDRRYRVAATDYEVGTYGGYADPDWRLEIEYDGTTIMREAVEDYLRRHGRARRPASRLVADSH